MKYKNIFILLICSAFLQSVNAQIRLPRIVRDSMILQREATVKIWGWASANEKVNVKFNNKTYKTKASAEGNWSVLLPPVKAGGPYTLTIAGNNAITLKDILFGDVFFCSGQSNMVHQMNIHDITYAKDIQTANFPAIRQFLIPTLADLQTEHTDVNSGSWQAAIGDNVRPFSAVAYFFARKLYEQYQVPIGLINASVGGTPIEAWTSEEGFRQFADIEKIIQKNKDTAYINSTNRNAAIINSQRPKENDKGLTSTPKWFEPNYNPASWRSINIPGYWEDQGISNLNGIVWYRKEIDVPATMTGIPAKLFLGRIIDADVVYINGKQVGNTTYQYPQRRYPLAAGILKAGKNTIVIRVTNNYGKGGFVPDKPYNITAGNQTLDLKGEWLYKVGDVFPPFDAAATISAQNQPASLYNGMVAPVINYTVKGFLWYQGEANTGNAAAYNKLTAALIADWRNKWKQPTAPFLYVQLPNYMDANYLPSESQWAALREAQLKALSIPNTAMAVAIDLGEWNDIHPDNKKDVGERLALAAQKIVYGENIVYSGPIYQSNKIEGNKIIISFTNTGSGLITNNGEELSYFAIAGADKKFVWAKAKIEGNTVVVWNDAVATPMYVRYAWADNPEGANLYNKEGLPASPFRTDN